MGKIRLLSDQTASQVAAGEVVERPASVAKELMENSLDAGATRIDIEFARGGAHLLRVSDDGCGMERDDALLSLERHATSKIRSSGDLATVLTMGFRGEALPSIASVSQFRLDTREPDSAAGTLITVAGGKIESVRDSGRAQGTTIEVRSLFYNVPARRKFLRGEETEAAHIQHQIQSLALANPQIAFSAVRDGKPFLHAAATDNLGVRIRDVFGAAFLERLAPLEHFEQDSITISGWLAKPGETRADRSQQLVILNGRVVDCPAVFQALREAYAGKHPIGVIVIRMNPEEVDCNVHPAKREVRLRNPNAMRQAVFQAAQQGLERSSAAWKRQISSAPSPAPVIHAPQPIVHAPAPAPAPLPITPALTQTEMPRPEPVGQPQPEEPPPAKIDFRLVGGLGDHYVLMENEDGLVLLNVRAAMQRVLFESLQREMAEDQASSQRLLLPAIAELPPKDAAWIAGNLELLRRAGFQIEPFGGQSVKIEGVPACLQHRDPERLLLEVCDQIRLVEKAVSGQLTAASVARTVCRLASEERFVYAEDRARRLVHALLRCDLPYACPYGHPTIIQFPFSELERKFGRPR